MKIIVTPTAAKQYKNLPPSDKRKIDKKLALLQTEPYAGNKLSGSLSELRSLKAWPYRILYFINNKQHTIFIASILHRQGAYK